MVVLKIIAYIVSSTLKKLLNHKIPFETGKTIWLK